MWHTWLILYPSYSLKHRTRLLMTPAAIRKSRWKCRPHFHRVGWPWLPPRPWPPPSSTAPPPQPGSRLRTTPHMSIAPPAPPLITDSTTLPRMVGLQYLSLLSILHILTPHSHLSYGCWWSHGCELQGLLTFTGDDRSQKRTDDPNDSEDSLPGLTIDMGAPDPVQQPPVNEPKNCKPMGQYPSSFSHSYYQYPVLQIYCIRH